jgi:hypothetical protein
MTVLALPRHLSPPPEEAAGALEALVREVVATGTPRQALLLRLSRLPRALPHHLRLAMEALEPLTAADRARMFLLPNGDAAVVWRGPAAALLAETRTRLAMLFAGIDDAEAGASAPKSALALHLGLPEEADLLLAAATASVQPPAPAAPAAPRAPLDPATLGTLEEALGSADLSRFARRRPVCSLVPGEGMKLAWENRVLSLTELADTLVPGFDLEAAPWLFRRLTRILDLRMMALLSAPQELDRARLHPVAGLPALRCRPAVAPARAGGDRAAAGGCARRPTGLPVRPRLCPGARIQAAAGRADQAAGPGLPGGTRRVRPSGAGLGPRAGRHLAAPARAAGGADRALRRGWRRGARLGAKPGDPACHRTLRPPGLIPPWRGRRAPLHSPP